MKLHQHKKQLLILMVLLLFVSQACTDIFVPGLPTMTHEFDTTLNRMNLSISVYTYAQAFFFLIIGVVSDLFGRRKVLITCISALVLASFAIAFTNSLFILLFLRIIQAIGSAAIYIVLRLVIKDVMDKKEQIHATGMLLIGLVLSPALAPVVGAEIINFFGWRYCFITLGASLGILLAWLSILVHETNYNIAYFKQTFNTQNHLNHYLYVLKDRMFFMLMIVVGGTFASYYGFIAISSYMYIDEYKISNTIYSYTFIGLASAYLLGNRIMLYLNKNQINSLNIIRSGLTISVIGLCLMVLSLFISHNTIIILGLATCGIFLVRLATAFINPPIQVLVTHHFGDAGSHAIGLLSCLQYIFAGIGIAVVSDLPTKPSISLVVSSVIFTIISIIGYTLCPKKEITG